MKRYLFILWRGDDLSNRSFNLADLSHDQALGMICSFLTGPNRDDTVTQIECFRGEPTAQLQHMEQVAVISLR